jgi:hypothetical protein
VGVSIHPAMTEGQDLGAATMGLGVGLFEESIYDGQQLMNGTMLEYRVPRMSDLPRGVRLKLVQNRDGVNNGAWSTCPFPKIRSFAREAPPPRLSDFRRSPSARIESICRLASRLGR